MGSNIMGPPRRQPLPCHPRSTSRYSLAHLLPRLLVDPPGGDPADSLTYVCHGIVGRRPGTTSAHRARRLCGGVLGRAGRELLKELVVLPFGEVYVVRAGEAVRCPFGRVHGGPAPLVTEQV